MDYIFRPLTAADEPILWEMLYQALHTSQKAPPRDIIKHPEFARYVESWGRAGDAGRELGPRCSRNWSKPIHTTQAFPSEPRQTIPLCVFMDASDSKSCAKAPIQLRCNGTFEILPILHERDTEKIIENSWRLQ